MASSIQLGDPPWAAPWEDQAAKAGSKIFRPWRQWLLGIFFAAKAAPQIVAVPATSTAAGTPGQVAFGGGFYYVCVATNTWQRAALSSF